MTADTTDDGAVVVVRPALEAAVAGTVSHPPDGLVDVPHTATGHRTSFEVTAEGSLQAARRLHLAGFTTISPQAAHSRLCSSGLSSRSRQP
ncbi:PARG family protein [Nonomuraea aurantiaca]|uniref:PARG family protein n=1 Tax=Nonomuraea aurantiaca TaxID=2878562 RepID=UPI001CD96088|nr:PARG family protein [Nonomuraea aurantiaca]MCA2224748.1 PARG family protein [Nonomuraea aurantiaca]